MARGKQQTQADVRRQKQWRFVQAKKLYAVDTIITAANDYMLGKYEEAALNVPPREPTETWSAYHARRGRHQRPIEELMAPLRRRAEPSPVGMSQTLRRISRPIVPKPAAQVEENCKASSSGNSSSGSDVSSESGADQMAEAAGTGFQGAPCLQEAAANGNLDLVQVLLCRGADPNCTEGDVAQETPLHAAAQYGHMKIMEALLTRASIVRLQLLWSRPLTLRRLQHVLRPQTRR